MATSATPLQVRNGLLLMTTLHKFTVNCDAVANHCDVLSGEDAVLNYENKYIVHQGPGVTRYGLLRDCTTSGPLPFGFMGLTAYKVCNS